MTARMDLNNEKPPDKNIQKQSPPKIWGLGESSKHPRQFQDTSSMPKKGGFFITLSSIIMVQWKIAIFAREKHIGDTRNFSTELLDYPRKKSWKLLGSCLEWRFPGYEHMIPPPPKRKERIWRISEPACLQHRIGDRCLAIILAFCHSISGVLGCFQQLLIAGKITFLGTITLIPTSKPALLSRWCMDDAWFSEFLVWWEMDSSSGGVHVYTTYLSSESDFLISLLRQPKFQHISTQFSETLPFKNHGKKLPPIKTKQKPWKTSCC